MQRSHIVETEPFSETFGPKAQRKKARIEVGTFEELSKLGTAAAEDAEQAANALELGASAHSNSL
jgi:nuclear GTP-binding protein